MILNNRELRGTDDGGADALAGIDQRQAEPPAQLARQGGREWLGDIAVLFVLMSENIFGNAAGERQRGWRSRARQGLGKEQRLTEAVEGRAADHVGRDHGEALRDAAADRFVGERLR